MKKLSIYFLFVSLLVLSCKNTDTKSTSDQVAVQNQGIIPPAIPAADLIYLFENCTFIDFIFANLPFSMSQEDKASIQQTIRHIVPVAPTQINPECQHLVELLFQVEGEIINEVKIFFQPECTYYLFYKNGVAVYSASFNEQGINFFNNILQQVGQTRGNG